MRWPAASCAAAARCWRAPATPLQRDGFSYLLAMRLIPAFPFWLVNLAAAIGGMRLLPYATATLIGIIPATLVFASLGEGWATVLAQGRRPDLMVAFSPPVLLPLLALAALSLLPVAWRRWKAAAMAEFDLAVIGAGAAGLSVTAVAARLAALDIGWGAARGHGHDAIAAPTPASKLAGLALPYPIRSEAGKRAADMLFEPRQFPTRTKRVPRWLQRV